MKSLLGFHRRLDEKKGKDWNCEWREGRGVREQRYDGQCASSFPWSRDFVPQPEGLKIASEELAAGQVTCYTVVTVGRTRHTQRNEYKFSA